jgi:hypothetical protein
MALFLIAYDLDKPKQNYEILHEQLKKWGAIHVLESTWVVTKDSTAAKIGNDLLTEALDDDDRLVVVEVKDGGSYNAKTILRDLIVL